MAKIRRFVHSKTNGEHQGINFDIQEDGKIILKSEHQLPDLSYEYDEVIIPASLVFKLATMLEATRKVHWVEESEVKK